MDINLRPTWDDSEIAQGIQSTIADLQDGADAFDDLNKSSSDASRAIANDLSKAGEKAKDSIDKIAKAQKDSNKETKESINLYGAVGGRISRALQSTRNYISGLTKQQTETKKLTAERIKYLRTFIESKRGLVEEIKNTNILGTNLGQVAKVFKQVVTVGRSWIKVLGATKVAIAATGIGALLIVITSVAAALKRTQEGQDGLNKIFAAGGEIINSVIDALSSIGSGIIKLLTGDFEGAVAAFKGSIDEIKGAGEDAVAAFNLEGASQKLRDSQNLLRREVAETRNEIKALNKDSEDVTLSFEQRAFAAERAGKLESELVRKRIELEDENVRIIEDKLSLGKNLAEDEEALTEAIESRNGVELESLELQTTIQNKLNAIRLEEQRSFEAAAAERKKLQDEELARVQKLTNEYVKQTENLAKQLLDVELEGLDPVARLNKQRQIAIQGLNDQRASLVALAQDLGKPIDDINEKFDSLIRNTNFQFGRLIEQTQSNVVRLEPEVELDLKTSDLDTTALDSIKNLIKERTELDPASFSIDIAPPTQAASQPFLDGVSELFDNVLLDEDAQQGLKLAESLFGDQFQDTVNSLLGDLITLIDSEDIGSSISASFGIAATLIETFTSGTDAQIENLDKLREQREDAIDDLRGQLEREQELFDKGLANNLKSTEDQIKEQLQLQEEADRQSLELKKKRIKEEAAANLAKQVSEASLAITQVFAAHSGIPFVGVLLAAGFVAQMIATIKSANDQINALNTTSLYTGGQLDEAIQSNKGGARRDGEVMPGGRSDKPGRNSQGGYRVYDPVTNRDVGVQLGGQEIFTNEEASQEHKEFLRKLNKGAYRGVDLEKALSQSASPVTSKAAKVLMSTAVQTRSEDMAELKNEVKALRQSFENDKVPVIYKDEIIFVDKSKYKSMQSVIKGRRDV